MKVEKREDKKVWVCNKWYDKTFYVMGVIYAFFIAVAIAMELMSWG